MQKPFPGVKDSQPFEVNSYTGIAEKPVPVRWPMMRINVAPLAAIRLGP